MYTFPKSLGFNSLIKLPLLLLLLSLLFVSLLLNDTLFICDYLWETRRVTNNELIIVCVLCIGSGTSGLSVTDSIHVLIRI